MITSSDLISMPVSEETLVSAANFAKFHILKNLIEDPAISNSPHFRNTILTTVTELSFRKYLQTNNIPHQIRSSGSEQAKPHVTIGNRECDLHCYFFSNHIPQGRSLQDHLFTQQILIHRNQPMLNYSQYEKLEVFCFFSNSTPSVERSTSTLTPGWSIFFTRELLPINAQNYSGRIGFDNPTLRPLTIEIAGTTADGKITTEALTIGSLSRSVTATIFSSLIFIQTNDTNPKKLTLVRAGLPAIPIPSSMWTDLDHLGDRITFAGYLHHSEMRVMLENKLRNDTRYRINFYKHDQHIIKVLELNPLPRLFELAKQFDKY